MLEKTMALLRAAAEESAVWAGALEEACKQPEKLKRDDLKRLMEAVERAIMAMESISEQVLAEISDPFAYPSILRRLEKTGDEGADNRAQE